MPVARISFANITNCLAHDLTLEVVTQRLCVLISQ